MSVDGWQVFGLFTTFRKTVAITSVGLSVIVLATLPTANGQADGETPVASSPETTAAVVTTTEAPNTTTTSTTVADATLTTRLAAYTRTRSGTVSVAIFDAQTGVTFTSGTGSFDTASIIKLAILEATVLKAQKTGQSLTPSEHRLATSMISTSDNAAATTLWNTNGGAKGMQTFFHLIGTTHTTTNTKWGLTQTTATDQLTVLRAFAYANDVFNDASRETIAGYLATVVQTQHWGVSGGVDDSDDVLLKNGWLPQKSGWDINSIGHVQSNGRDYAIAVLTKNNPSQAYGIATADGVSRLVWQSFE